MIVTDDSPDDRVEQLVSHYRLGGRLHYFRNQPALGTPENWNEGMHRARGEYLKPMFHDDWFLDETSLGKFVAMMTAQPAANFGFAVQKVWHAPSDHYATYPLNWQQQQKLARAPEWLFFRNRVGVPSATIYRRQLNHFYDPQLIYAVDWEFYLRAIKTNHCFAYHPAPLVCVSTGLDFQVTQSCYGNKSIELFEYAHIFNQLYHKKFDLRFFYYWIKLFRQFQIDAGDPDYQKVCRLYPTIAPYLALALQGATLVKLGTRMQQRWRRQTN